MKSPLTGLKVVIIGVFVFFTAPWILLYIGLSLTENPPKPAYTYGEFPFYLEYEIDGQVKTVEDTVIVEFDGFGLSEGSGGKYVQWKKSLASGNKEIVLYKDGKGEEEVSLLLSVLYQSYGLQNELQNGETTVPGVIKREGSLRSAAHLHEYELLTEYKLKWIKFEYGESIIK
ncbi:hypothetical protein ACK8P5_08545 [Paenibacillus sp. EC2-1]|uniref:hypothetical protein n=1 Tax=Paenibacillus sp. EC2-1 TaxID=3388665 RepID=UPI003BEF4733